VITIAKKHHTKPPNGSQLFAVLVTLAVIVAAFYLRLQGAELGAVLVAALGVALA
jgi:hypothetical protein